jgi:hypothetical protein
VLKGIEHAAVEPQPSWPGAGATPALERAGTEPPALRQLPLYQMAHKDIIARACGKRPGDHARSRSESVVVVSIAQARSSGLVGMSVGLARPKGRQTKSGPESIGAASARSSMQEAKQKAAPNHSGPLRTQFDVPELCQWLPQKTSPFVRPQGSVRLVCPHLVNLVRRCRLLPGDMVLGWSFLTTNKKPTPLPLSEDAWKALPSSRMPGAEKHRGALAGDHQVSRGVGSCVAERKPSQKCRSTRVLQP